MVSSLAAVLYPPLHKGAGMQSTYPSVRWALVQHAAADKRSCLHVTQVSSMWAGHACTYVTGEGTVMHVATVVGLGACVCV